MVLLSLLLACTGGADSGVGVDGGGGDGGATDGGASDGGSECPELDCRDTLTVVVLDPAGAPSTWFAGQLSPPDASPIAFACGAEPKSFEGGLCNGDGSVDLYAYAESFSGWVDEGDDAPWWSGSLSPEWTAPYDSEECGHYCWLATETVQLQPCENCG